MLVVHGVKRDDALHVGGGQLEDLSDLGHRPFTHPPTLALHDPERGEQHGHLRWVSRQQRIELRAGGRREHGTVFLGVPMAAITVRCVTGRGVRRAYLGGRHRSISPITMSMLALIAITSDRRCPSTIFGIADRFTNDGGRMRQRTGFEVPSDTM